MPLFKVTVRGGLTLGVEKHIPQGESVELLADVAASLPVGTVEIVASKPVETKTEEVELKPAKKK